MCLSRSAMSTSHPRVGEWACINSQSPRWITTSPTAQTAGATRRFIRRDSSYIVRRGTDQHHDADQYPDGRDGADDHPPGHAKAVRAPLTLVEPVGVSGECLRISANWVSATRA